MTTCLAAYSPPSSRPYRTAQAYVHKYVHSRAGRDMDGRRTRNELPVRVQPGVYAKQTGHVSTSSRICPVRAD